MAAKRTKQGNSNTTARRNAAMARLAPWAEPGKQLLAAHILTEPFKIVARFALLALKAHNIQLGDYGPLSKDYLALVGANALRALTDNKAETVICDALTNKPSGLVAATAKAMIEAKRQDGAYILSLAQSVAAPPMPEPTLNAAGEVADPKGSALAAVDAALRAVAGTSVASVIAQSVAQSVAAPVQTPIAASIAAPSVTVDPEPVAQSVAAPPSVEAKPKRKAKADAPANRDDPEWQAAYATSPAMQARPSGDWRRAADVFGLRGLQGYVEFIGSTHPMVPVPDPDYVFNEEIMQEIVESLNEEPPMPTWLWGERGVGKSTLAQEIAARLKRPFFKVTYDVTAELATIIGAKGLKGGDTTWDDGAVCTALRCMEAPILLHDEISQVKADYMTGPLNEIIHPLCQYRTPAGELIEYDRRLWHVAADNTNGRGDSTGRFTGARQQNAALVDRFGASLQIVGLTKAEEISMIQKRASVPKELAERTQGVLHILRQKVGEGALAEPPSQREAIAFAKRMRSGRRSPTQCFEVTFAGKYPLEAQEEMRAAFLAYWNGPTA